jgi:hypothetical protein
VLRPRTTPDSHIVATTIKTGLTLYARLDNRDYPKGIEVNDAQLTDVIPPDLHHHPVGKTDS